MSERSSVIHEAIQAKSNVRALPPLSQKSALWRSSRLANDRSRTTHACDRCRQMRTECSGGAQCSKCVADDATCLYSERAKESTKRVYAKLETEVESLREDLKTMSDLTVALQSQLQEQQSAWTSFQNDTGKVYLNSTTSERQQEINDGTNAAAAAADSGNFPETAKWIASQVQPQSQEDPNVESSRPSKTPTDSATRNLSTPQTTARSNHISSAAGRQSPGPNVRFGALRPNRPSWKELFESEATTSARRPFESWPRYPRDIFQQSTPTNFEQPYQSGSSRRPEWQNLPRILYDGDSLSRVATDFIMEADGHLSDGMDMIEILGDSRTDVQLYFRARNDRDRLTASNWACELQKTFQGEYSCTLQLAEVFMLTRLMRWLLAPSQETFTDLPTMMRPTVAQLLHPHPIIVDMMPLAPIRDRMILGSREIIQATIKAGIIVNWTSPLSDAISVDHDTGAVYLQPDFTSAISDPRNWIVGSDILDEFPGVSGLINVADQRHIAAKDRLGENSEYTELQRRLQETWANIRPS